MPLSADCVSRVDLRSLAVAALLAANTSAVDRVYDPNTLPTNIQDMPVLVVSAPSERKDTSGDGAPQFDTTVMLAIMGRVSSTVQAEANAMLDLLIDQVQRAILSGMCARARPVQRVVYVETHSVLNREGGTFVGEATMIFGLLVQQLYEPDGGEPFLGGVITTAEPPRSGPSILFP